MRQLHNFHSSKMGYLVFAIVELAMAYGFASLAIDRGNFLWYLLTLLFLVGFLQNLYRLIGSFAHADAKR